MFKLLIIRIKNDITTAIMVSSCNCRNVYLQILLLMTLLYWTLAVFSNWVRHTNLFTKLRSKLK